MANPGFRCLRTNPVLRHSVLQFSEKKNVAQQMVSTKTWAFFTPLVDKTKLSALGRQGLLPIYSDTFPYEVREYSLDWYVVQSESLFSFIIFKGTKVAKNVLSLMPTWERWAEDKSVLVRSILSLIKFLCSLNVRSFGQVTDIGKVMEKFGSRRWTTVPGPVVNQLKK